MRGGSTDDKPGGAGTGAQSHLALAERPAARLQIQLAETWMVSAPLTAGPFNGPEEQRTAWTASSHFHFGGWA